MRSYLFLVAFLLAACSFPGATATSPTQTSTPLASNIANTATPEATSEPTVIAGQTQTPAPLPSAFETDTLRPGILPVNYFADQCEFLESRWDPEGALPGTVVAPIMFHSILQDGQPSIDQNITAGTFADIIAAAERLGYETITTEELLAFLEFNAKIPPRSMIMILDDRRAGTAEEHFLSVLERNGWTVTMAWIALWDTDQRPGLLAGETLWESIERLYATGYLDIQSHGRDHIYLQEGMSEETVRLEIEGSIPPLQEHFGITPIAYIWPGGNYTQLGLDIAHEAGFELGFTIQSRGPIMFNWIPQGEAERALDDPLLLLPRFWSSAATLNLEEAAAVGDAAQAFAQENYATEAAWFSQNCSGDLPPLDEIFK